MAATPVSFSGFWSSASSSSSSNPPSLSFLTSDSSSPGTYRNPYPGQITSEVTAANQVVNTSIIPGAWGMRDRTEKFVPSHLPIFAYRDARASVTLTYEKSIRALNLFLEERGTRARDFWLRPPGAPSKAERDGIISREDYEYLMRIPTSAWMRERLVEELLADQQNEKKQLLRYLFSDGIVSMWNFIGFKPNEDKPMIPTTFSEALPANGMHALSFAGHIISVNNIWGNSICAADTLGLSLEPIKKQGKRDGIFLLHPIKNQGKCMGRAFEDVTGFPRYSHVYWIGTIKDWTSKPKIVDEDSIWAYLRLVDGPTELADSYNPDKSLTIWCHR